MTRFYDIVILGDFRFPGGTSTAIAAEIEAQARAGYRTGLLSLKAPLLRFPHPIHPQITAQVEAGRADLLDPDLPVSAGLLLVHHPQVLTHLPAAPLRPTAEHILLIAHHPPYDADGVPFYDWRRIDANAAAMFGRRIPWAPVGPAVRRQLQGLIDGPAVWPRDWHNVLDPAAWRVVCREPGEVPVIGRHSRPDLLKWPATREETLLVYPPTPDFRVRVLGADAGVTRFLDPLPATWELLPFGAVPVQEFLAGLDVYVFFHHPRWVEAFGRTLIEAMASGLPVILPHPFAELFGEAAVYAEPAEVGARVRALHADRPAWAAQSERARAAIETRFSLRQHVKRVAELIGAPVAGRMPRVRPRQRPRTVLFFTSNGVGLGHVTRALAIAKRCGEGIEPVFVTLSQAAGLIEEAGFTTEYLPFHAYLGADVNRWNRHLATELREMVRFYDPCVILFDGNTPYAGLLEAIQAASRAWSVWVRRGFWRSGSGATALEREAAFDAVIEPEDLAEILDHGPTTQQRGRTRRVAPIRLLDSRDLLPRLEARRALGLPETGICVLLQLGSGNNFDFGTVQERAIARLSQVEDLSLALLESPISLELETAPAGVRVLRLFPASAYLHAFEFVISAVGYNSYHELLLSGTPALFVPNEHPMMDDQRARAEHAERMGWSLALRTGDIYRLNAKLAQLLDADERAGMRRRMASLPPTNGADEAARIVREMAFTVRADRPG